MSSVTNVRVLRALEDLRQDPAFPAQVNPARPLAQAMREYATPAVSIAVVDDFQAAWSGAFGLPRTGARKAVSQSTLFQAGSISKVVFALAVMKLAEKGEVDLDEDVNQYLTSWRVPANDGWTPRVTLRQLLSHTAGTTVHGFPGYPASATHPDVVRILNGEPPSNTTPVVVDILPGTQFRYSGGGTIIAQQAIVDRLRTPFAELMRELILDPLGLTDSTFAQPLPRKFAARAAAAHPWNGVRTPGDWHVYPEMAAAGLWTTAGDLARLGAEVLRTLRGDRSVLGLTQDSIAQMLRPQLPHQKEGQDFVGLGWFCSGSGAAFEFGHHGQDEGFLAVLKLYRSGRGAAVMVNSIQGWRLRNEIISALGREFGWPLRERSSGEAPAGNYAGSYRHRDGLTVEISQAGEVLHLRFDRQPPIALERSDDGEFAARVINLRLRFAGPDGSVPTALTAYTGSAVLEFLRND